MKKISLCLVFALAVLFSLCSCITVFAEEIQEIEPNDNKKSANVIEKGMILIGKLGNESDVDWYTFFIQTQSDVTFDFKHQASSAYSYCWYMTIYSDDGLTVLKEGSLSGRENTSFTMSDMAASTYYIKISRISGGNPFMNGYDGADYYLCVTPLCKHQTGDWEKTKEPGCIAEGERVQKCTICGEVITKEGIPAAGHSFGEWKETKEATAVALGEKTRVCSICGETETAKVWDKVWILPAIVLAGIAIIIGIVNYFKAYKRR